jgi:predicted NodU family carbamoyl transferase
VANVKLNQRLRELPGVERLFVHPNMGDGGCGTGAALLAFNGSSARSEPIADVFWGPCFNEAQLGEALSRAQLPFDRYTPIEPKIAQLIAEGKVVARFDGRMEYGPRALGNRSILYHAREPEVNQWLNQRLGRTEFMPFAPATLYEHRDDCYKNIDGADYAAQFMTVTFDCTERMKRECPAAVHVDGTARPQLVTPTSNPSFHRIISEYHRLTGIPSGHQHQLQHARRTDRLHTGRCDSRVSAGQPRVSGHRQFPGGASEATALSNQRMVVLGISGRERDAASALLIDGALVAATTEEACIRTPRVGYGYAAGFPFASVEACLQRAGITARDVQRMVLCDEDGHTGICDAPPSWMAPLRRRGNGTSELNGAAGMRVGRLYAHASQLQATSAADGPNRRPRCRTTRRGRRIHAHRQRRCL